MASEPANEMAGVSPEEARLNKKMAAMKMRIFV
jgi:hypothetical protein